MGGTLNNADVPPFRHFSHILSPLRTDRCKHSHERDRKTLRKQLSRRCVPPPVLLVSSRREDKRAVWGGRRETFVLPSFHLPSTPTDIRRRERERKERRESDAERERARDTEGEGTKAGRKSVVFRFYTVAPAFFTALDYRMSFAESALAAFT